MKNPFKGNTLACGLLGFILGIGATFGAQQICSQKTWGESHYESGGDGSKDNFSTVETDVNGDVFFTKSGSFIMVFASRLSKKHITIHVGFYS